MLAGRFISKMELAHLCTGDKNLQVVQSMQSLIPVSAFRFAPAFTLALNNYYSAFQVPSVLLISKCLQVYWKQIF